MKTILLDKESLLSFNTCGHEDMPDLLQEYSRNSDSLLQELHRAYTAGPRELKRCLLFNSSAFRYAGFPQLTDAFRELSEKCATVQVNGEIEKDFAQLILMIRISVRIAITEITSIERSLNTPNRKTAGVA